MRKTLAVACALAVAAIAPALASSHREAPLITKMPKVDATDFYAFTSYEPGRGDYVTLVANYLPLQDAYGGPNYFALDPNAVYRILVDNDGDAREDLTFEIKVNLTKRDIAIPVGDETVPIPLLYAGQVLPGSPAGANRDAAANELRSYTVWVRRGEGPAQNASDAETGSTRFGYPSDNVGNKTFPDYHAYAARYVRPISIPGCAGTGRVFVGQRKDSFAVNLGEIFDLVNLSNPLGPRDAQPNTLADKNVTTIALEVPKACLTAGHGPTIGTWTTAALPRTSVLSPDGTQTPSGNYVQVSRLGMPLVNEVVIGLKDKDRFNSSEPRNDGQFATYVTNPTLPALIEILFGAAGVKAPTNFPRTDLVAAFLTGVDGLNKFGQAAEYVRLNTSIAPTPKAQQSNLGVLGGDNAGFPNGRRPGDDVVDIELRVAMGVLCHAFPGAYCSPADAPSGTLPFTDGTLQDPSQFGDAFPYLADPVPGSPNGVNGEPPGQS